jgi:16S rRNA (guanine1207-N2)-methyltransferase
LVQVRNRPGSYYQSGTFTAVLHGQPLQIVSKPGLSNWDRITPATVLLAETVEVAPDAQVLQLGCGHGALGAALARQVPGGHVVLMDIDFIALTMAEQTLKSNGAANAQVRPAISVLPDGAGAFDTVAMELPKGRKLARRWLVEAQAALKPGGALYLAGANEQGIQPAIQDTAALFGGAAVLRYKKGNRVARAAAGRAAPAADQPGWAGEAGIAPGTWREFEVVVRGYALHLRSLPGVFAFDDELDEGTRLLLDCLDVAPGAQAVLDMGCGYGIIGLVAARLGASHVDMVDVNLLAIASARENIAANGIANAEAFLSDAFSAVGNRRYDLIASNPPFHTGKSVDYAVAHAFIEHARATLKPGGRLLLVANKFIRYDQLMRTTFNTVECLVETNKYHVLRGF